MTKTELGFVFNKAVKLGFKYVAVKVRMDGFLEDEVIINGIENALGKLEWYNDKYDDELNHKFSKGVKIVDATYGNTYDSIEWDLLRSGEL